MTLEARPLPWQSTTLPSGARVVTAALPHLARAHVGLTLRGGPCHEDDRTWGLSHLVEHMLFRGTRHHEDARAVSLAADRFGGEVDGSTFRDRVLYDTRADPERVGEAVALLGEMLLHPRFEGLEVEKGIIHEELLEALDDDGQEIDADNLVYRDLFAGRPLARSIDGTLDTLESFGADDLRAFHQSHYPASAMVLCAAGPVDHAEVVEAARTALGGEPGRSVPAGVAHGKGRRKKPLHVVRTDDSQTTFRLVFEVEGQHAPERWPLRLLTRVLDDGPAARLPSRLIDREGLAYELWASQVAYEDCGALEIGGQVQHDRVGDVVDAVVRELEDILRAPVEPEELARVQDRVARDLRDFRDMPDELVESLSRAALFGLPFDLPAALAGARAVTPGLLQDKARAVLRLENAALVLVGLPGKKQVARAEAALARLG